MALELEIKVEGLEDAEGRLTRLGQRAVMAAPAFAEIYEVMLESERALWARGISPPDAPITIERKGDATVLERTGALRRSLTATGAGGHIRELSGQALKFGSSLWYAHFALGTQHQPRRELIKLRPTDRAKIHVIIARWLAGEF